MKIDNVKFEMEFDSGNQAVVDDPIWTVARCLDQVRNKLPVLAKGGQIPLRDANGSRIGYAYLEIEMDDEDDLEEAA